MRSLDKLAASERRAKQSTPSRLPHRRHRHKKFHVRPEAVGIGYESFPRSSSPSSAAAPVISSGKDDIGPVVEPSSESLSEKEIARATALKGIRACLMLLGLLAILVFIRLHFGSFNEFGRWVVGNVPQPLVKERSTHGGSAQN